MWTNVGVQGQVGRRCGGEGEGRGWTAEKVRVENGVEVAARGAGE